MAGYDGDFLYRLLREDEHPLSDGIMAKYPSRNETPAFHIRNCSRNACKWISTCASEEAMEKLIELKRKQIDKGKITDACFRYVEIDRKKLETYAQKSDPLDVALFEAFQDSIVRIVPLREKTGKILDFTDSDVMKKYLPKSDQKYKIQRNFANFYEEVLVERFIPPHCCTAVYDGEKIYKVGRFWKMREKKFISGRECSKYLPPFIRKYLK
jgi:hypothetical protein